MKSLFFTVLFLIIYFIGHGQSTEVDVDESVVIVPSFNKEIGLNITGLANQFLSFNGNTINQGTYLFTFKNNIDNAKFFRMGVGMNFFSTIDEEDNNNPEFTNNFAQINLRLGVEKQLYISKKWMFSYGLDFPLAFFNQVSNSVGGFENVKIKSSNYSLGLGPVVGIHFNLGKKIRLGTEATFYLNYSRNTSKTEIDGNEMPNNKQQSFSGNLRSPAVLYLGISI